MWMFLRTVFLYKVQMAQACLNLLQTPGRGGKAPSLDKDPVLRSLARVMKLGTLGLGLVYEAVR